MQGAKRKNITNQRFGKLVAVRCLDKKNSKGNYIWECICDCGGKKDVGVSYLTSKHTTSCGCSLFKMRKLFGFEYGGHNRKDFGLSNFLDLYRRYKRGANKRNIIFNLNLEQFKSIIVNNCFYCNASPNHTYKPNFYSKINGLFVHNGIDRLDNTKGYEISNCVACCTGCNFCKGKFSKEEFLNIVKKIYEHNFKT